MSQSTSKPAILDIKAYDSATEIFVIDANLRRIATGLGNLNLNVEPGIYKVRFRSSTTQHDELVEVLDPGSIKRVVAPPIEFQTSAPIHDTRTTHEYHSYSAAETSRNINMNLGSDGELFLFVREEDEAEIFTADGISIHNLDGVELASIKDGTKELQNRWAALNIKIDQGTYRVRVTNELLGPYEIFASVTPGWQTQVFLITEYFYIDNKKIKIPSLHLASILMSQQGVGFSPDNKITRLSELARHAISQGRNILSPSLMNDLLSSKFEDPMLGLIAAHLLIRKQKLNINLLNEVCDNLLAILGEHPDLQAIMVLINDQSRYPVKRIERPPTLKLSWDAIVKGTRRRASLVQYNSTLATIGEETVESVPWLIHQVKMEQTSKRTEKLSIDGALKLIEKISLKEPDFFCQKINNNNTLKKELTGLELSLLTAVKSYAQGREFVTKEGEAVDTQQSVRNIYNNLSAPSYSVTNAVQSLAEKLDII